MNNTLMYSIVYTIVSVTYILLDILLYGLLYRLVNNSFLCLSAEWGELAEIQLKDNVYCGITIKNLLFLFFANRTIILLLFYVYSLL